MPREDQAQLIKQNKQYSQEISVKPMNRHGLAFSIQSTNDHLLQNNVQTQQMIRRQEQQDQRQFMMQSTAKRVQLTLENQPKNENQPKFEQKQFFMLHSANLKKQKENYQQQNSEAQPKPTFSNMQNQQFSDIQQVSLEIQNDLRKTEEFLLQNMQKSTNPLETLYHQQFDAALKNLSKTVDQFGRAAPETADLYTNIAENPSDPYYEMLQRDLNCQQATNSPYHNSQINDPQPLKSGVPKGQSLEAIERELAARRQIAAQMEADLRKKRRGSAWPQADSIPVLGASMPRTSYEPVASIAELERPAKALQAADLHLSILPESQVPAQEYELRPAQVALAPRKAFKTGMPEQKRAKTEPLDSHRPALRQPADKLTVHDLEDNGDNESDPIMDLALQLNDLEERSRIAKGRRNIFLIDK